MKSLQIRSFSLSVFFSIRTEYRKIRTRINSVFGHFSRSETYFLWNFGTALQNTWLLRQILFSEKYVFRSVYLGLFFTAQKMKFFTEDFFSKCDQIRRKLWIWPHLLKKSLLENFIFCAVIMLNVSLTKSEQSKGVVTSSLQNYAKMNNISEG